MPNAHYMDIQTEIQWSMRAVLMDWLIQVHNRFSLLPETLFLTVNYIDRFLSVKIVSLGKLQLVGATAIFVAAKYEEINCPSIQEIVYMVDSGYTMDEILKAERFMLSMLGFELGWPGPMSFLRRISKADDYDLETRTLAKYFLEVTVMDERFVGSPPSYVAAGAHCLSRLLLKKGEWVSSLLHSQMSHIRTPGLEGTDVVSESRPCPLLRVHLQPTQTSGLHDLRLLPVARTAPCGGIREICRPPVQASVAICRRTDPARLFLIILTYELSRICATAHWPRRLRVAVLRSLRCWAPDSDRELVDQTRSYGNPRLIEERFSEDSWLKDLLASGDRQKNWTSRRLGRRHDGKSQEAFRPLFMDHCSNLAMLRR
jgi:hypothetical protein